MLFLFLSLLVFSQEDPPYPERDAEIQRRGVPAVQDVGEGFPGFDGVSILWNRCSANLIAFQGYRAKQKALIVTSGHCSNQGSYSPWEGVSYPGSGEIIREQRVNESFVIFTNAHDNIPKRWIIAETELLVFATMTKRDLAVYQLKSTYEDLLKLGVKPAIVSRSLPKAVGEPIHFVSGLWQLDEKCKYDGLVETLKEAVWAWSSTLRMRYNKSCISMNGSSGAGIFDSANHLIGVFSTMSNSFKKPCDLGNPCEVDRNGKEVMRLRYNYFASTAFLYDCLNDDLRIDLDLSGCDVNSTDLNRVSTFPRKDP